MPDDGAFEGLSAVGRDVLACTALVATGPLAIHAIERLARSAEIVDARHGRALAGTTLAYELQALKTHARGFREVGRGVYGLALDQIATTLERAVPPSRLVELAERIRRSGDARPRWMPTAEPELSSTAALRLALATGDARRLALALESRARQSVWYRQDEPLVTVLGLAPPARWIAQLPDAERITFLREACRVAFSVAAPIGADVLDAALASEDAECVGEAATVLALRGDHAAAERALAAATPERGPSKWIAGAGAFVALTTGDFGEARRRFNDAARGARGQRGALPSYLAIFDLLQLGTSPVRAEYEALGPLLKKARASIAPWPAARLALERLAEFRTKGRTDAPHYWRASSWIDDLVTALFAAWSGTECPTAALEVAGAHARDDGYAWLARQCADLIAKRDDAPSLRGLMKQEAPWERALEAIAAAAEAAGDAKPASAADARGKIHWFVTAEPWNVRVQPNLVSDRQRRGSRVSLKRLATDDSIPIEPCDRPMVAVLLASEARHEPVRVRDLVKLAGHPRVFDATSGDRLEVVVSEATLRAEKVKSGVRLTLHPGPENFDDSGAMLRASAGKLEIVTLTPATERLRAVLEGGVTVPAKAMDRVRATLALASHKVPVDVEGLELVEADAADPRVRVQMVPAGAGLRVRLRVAPAPGAGASFRPGAPPERIVVPVAGGMHAVRRDLAAERADEARLLETAPILASLPFDGEDRFARDLETSLELLLELREAGAVVEWPEGQTMRAPSQARASQLQIRVGGGTKWLEVDGELRVDGDRVIAMRELLAGAANARGRFVPVGDDQFVALTADLRAKLESLARAQELAQKGRLSMGLLPAVEAWTEGLDCAFAAEVERARAAMQDAERLKPRVPRTLAAELRDYQREGFAFLVRRAAASLGACLADDMGLGKTIQALALLVHRASLGPALVVAPTSVCGNWEDEAARFAPSLRVRRLGAGPRKETVDGASAGDVIVASYGLIVAEQALLSSRRFSTVIFDEAHALKNGATRRWAAARAIDADAVVALTGTPVENHAGELHALFDVLIPGLMGSKGAFERAFGARIAQGDRDAAAALRQIVRPFVLRRTKAEVLSELPPKTEITRKIAATEEHRAFYEAVRARATERLRAAQDARGAGRGRARFELLAEITRLRRAAIDPRLVGGHAAPAGAKIDALAELVVELRAENRRALVFSQFLEVLDMAQAKLESSGIECRRLDGSMTAASREAEVAAFQSGQGDVFLLSLKAGGVGMNLTAADFVVHVDPWWNPAVEDQATDRAHRIGQTRPVTIVRLVTEGTIEEKVVALHGTKRQLYVDLVGDADGTGTLDLAALSELVELPPRA